MPNPRPTSIGPFSRKPGLGRAHFNELIKDAARLVRGSEPMTTTANTGDDFPTRRGPAPARAGTAPSRSGRRLADAGTKPILARFGSRNEANPGKIAIGFVADRWAAVIVGANPISAQPGDGSNPIQPEVIPTTKVRASAGGRGWALSHGATS